jgi:hypothetical protein
MRASVTQIGGAAGSATLPCISIYASANQGFILREAGIFNTTTTAARYFLVRLTTTGTQGAGLTEVVHGPDSTATILTTGFAPHSVAPTLGGYIAAMPIGAAIGAGTILSFYGENAGIYVPKGTSNGVGIIATGTGQVSDAYLTWDE